MHWNGIDFKYFADEPVVPQSARDPTKPTHYKDSAVAQLPSDNYSGRGHLVLVNPRTATRRGGRKLKSLFCECRWALKLINGFLITIVSALLIVAQSKPPWSLISRTKVVFSPNDNQCYEFLLERLAQCKSFRWNCLKRRSREVDRGLEKAVSCVLKLHANFPELLSTMSSHIPVDRFHFINIFGSIWS
jgi:hypothetical protein